MTPHPRRFAALSVLTLIVLSGCAQDTSTVAAPASPSEVVTGPSEQSVAPPAVAAAAPDLDRAKAAAQAFSGQLRGRLQAAMAEGGPLNAVEVCHTEAPRIAGTVMAEHGVRLGRVALPGRNRHPAQAADDWRLTTLERFRQAVTEGGAAGEQVTVMREGLPDGVALRMMRGIATEPGCLACHGQDVAAPVREAILARYPDDRATGFAVGDLRGALWVEVPVSYAN